MSAMRSAKIVATLGPASSAPETIAALARAGVDVFRLNFSHGRAEDHRRRVECIRDIERDADRPIGIIADLQGPKLRLGVFRQGEVQLADGAHFRLDLDAAPGDERRAPLPHPEIFAAIRPDTDLLINDGKVRLRVEACGADFAETTVIAGGPLSDRKGVNVPSVTLPISALTPKDRADLALALELGVDWVALSFVQRADDVAEGRKLIAGRAGVMVKLEKPMALQHLEEIVDLSDALMVARGDLGVEMPPEDVPTAQKRIIRACRTAGKPVIVATQMLESMIEHPVPTRAEASDVAIAVYDGADAVMLSAETAAGHYPAEAVAMMRRIICRVQQDPLFHTIMTAAPVVPQRTTADAISAAARQVAETLGVSAIVSYTTSGATAYRAARERPTVPILVLTAKEETARRLTLAWGTHCVHAPDVATLGEMTQRAVSLAKRAGLAAPGDSVVVTAGVPFGTPGATNILQVSSVS